MPSPPKFTSSSTTNSSGRASKSHRSSSDRSERKNANSSTSSLSVTSPQDLDDAMWYDEDQDIDDAIDDDLDEGPDDDDQDDLLRDLDQDDGPMIPDLGIHFHRLTGLLNGMSGRFRSLLQNLQRSAGNLSARLAALQELSEALSMATEDTLLGQFPTNAMVAELVACLGGAQPDRPAAITDWDEDAELAAVLAASGGGQDGQDEVAMYACRCIAHLLEALPDSARSIVKHNAVPLLVEKLQEVTFIDLAEQVLETLAKLSAHNAQAIVRAGGMQAMLQYLDFFSLYVQRTAMTTVANCCREIAPSNLSRVKDVLPMLKNALGHSDARLVEAATSAVCMIFKAFAPRAEMLSEVVGDCDIVHSLLTLLWRITGQSSGPALSAPVYAELLQALATTAGSSYVFAESLIANQSMELIFFLLSGALPTQKPSPTNILLNLAERPSAQVHGALALTTALLPALPNDGIFDPQNYTEKAYMALERRASREDLPIGQLDTHGGTSRRLSSAASKQARSIESRARIQSQWPNFYQRCISWLLPVLIEVCGASAEFDARKEVFASILRMLNYTDVKILEENMAQVPLASFLASVLASRKDDELAVESLQAIELLITKLPKIYDTLLIREGALHEIDLLAAAPGKGQWRAKLIQARWETRKASEAVLKPATSALDACSDVAKCLQDHKIDASGAKNILDRLATLLTQSEAVTSFELLHTGVVDALYTFITSDSYQMPLPDRRDALANMMIAGEQLTASAGSELIKSLHSSLSRMEDFPVAHCVYKGSNSIAQQVRLRLEAESDIAALLPPTFHTMMVSIHGVATVQTLHDFLRPKVELATSGKPMRGISEVLAALAQEDDEDDHEESVPPVLEQIPDESSGTESHSEADATHSDTRSGPCTAPGSESNSDWDMPVEVEAETEAPAMTQSSGQARASRGSYAAAVQSREHAWHLEFWMGSDWMPLNSTLYACVHRAAAQDGNTLENQAVHTVKFRRVPGEAAPAKPAKSLEQRTKTYQVTLPSCIPADAPYRGVLQLLGALHDLVEASRHRYSAMGLDDGLFLNNKLTAKLAQQLNEPLVVISACMPEWTEALPVTFPFLFSFQTRLAYFQATALGRARLLNRYKKLLSQPFDDVLQMLAQVPRQKVRIARNKLLPSAIKVLELYGSGRYALEVEYFDEVGSGSGPTLEFYALVSQAFARADLGIWRGDQRDERDPTYLDTRHGLYPTSDPSISPSTYTSLFMTLGRFIAKALLDDRLIDVPLHPVFFRQLLRQPIELDIDTVQEIDPTFARSLTALKHMPAPDLNDLQLPYTMPGTDTPLSQDVALVSDTNVHQYVKDVVHKVLDIESALNAFREGFNQVMPLNHLRIFSAEELVQLVAHHEEDWSEAALRRAILPDHGFTGESREILDLIAIMTSFDIQERQLFLQWLTGAKRLPMGGFQALQPPLTVVRRDHEPPLTADDYLPSVMTCVNYLKLPRYTSREVMRQRLYTAVHEGLTSFHLS
ncbi:HECT-type E3 ubiquitin transferase [Malassezia psittaci]|uniref:HECT-type E3 ubiquitin transferase n=1 Tax=Malassezia psittaci TaxID=1821823 RepID=A0AAF0JEK3_9BASI|nr:HECT-type E3 ubiquitin transferase [Malassezia psittaci]